MASDNSDSDARVCAAARVSCDGVTDQFGAPAFAFAEDAQSAVSALQTLASSGARDLDDESLLGLFDAAELIDRYFGSVRFAMLAELDARDLTDRRFGHTPGTQAAWRHGADRRRINSDLNCSHRLRRHLPAIADALRRAEVPVDRVRELVKHLNDRNQESLGEMQDALLAMLGARSTFRQFATDIEQIARLVDQDGAEPPLPRDVGTVERSGDKVTASFEMYGARGAGFAQRLSAEADRLYREAVADHERCADFEVPPRSELLATALVNLTEHGAAHRFTAAQLPSADMTIVLDVDKDSVRGLFSNGMLLPGRSATRCTHSPHVNGRSGDADGNGAGVSAGTRGHAGVRCADCEKSSAIDWSTRARDLAGAPLRYCSRDWEMLACDATYTWIIKGAGGQPIACKSQERTASREQRRALKYRDGRCVMPGCDAPADWCDAHHVVRHADGGPTDVNNMALLCRRHHGVIHRDGWTMSANSDPQPGEGYFVVTGPSGAVLHSQHARGPGLLRPVLA